MRPVSKERKPRDVRGKSGRSPARGIRRGAARPSPVRRGKRPGPLSRLFSPLKALLAGRRPVFWMTAGTLALTLLAALFASGFVGRTIHRTDAAIGRLIAEAGFGIEQVHLAGNMRTPTATIVAALGFTPGQSIFGVDLRAARARLMELPWVANAEVQRRYPDDIAVTITEKIPFARWQSPTALYVVERNGRPITAERVDTFTRLPLLLGPGAPETAPPIIAAVAKHRGVVARVQAFQYVSERRWNLLLDDGVVVKLPEAGWDKQLDALEHLIVDKGILENDIREIDLRSPTHYFFVRRTTGTDQKDKKPEGGSAI
ncbi:MAG: FtsQ-type POTRA domain-containing protein [Alphaproteobacteria bacterium]|nr:FtsQ-type POTRA domain-containing protein [Alphaproteobacteria bacterium]